MKRKLEKADYSQSGREQRIRGAVLFLTVLFSAALIIAGICSEITPAMLVCLIGGILAMLLSIYLKKKKQKENGLNSDHQG